MTEPAKTIWLGTISRVDRDFDTCMRALRSYKPGSLQAYNNFGLFVPSPIKEKVETQCLLEGILPCTHKLMNS